MVETDEEMRIFEEKMKQVTYTPVEERLSGFKTKSGERIGWAEAGRRFKEGLANITPIQKLSSEIRGTFITLLGFIVSFGAVIWKREAIGLLAYGLILIFLGSIITTFLRWLGLKQQMRFLTNQDDISIKLDKLNDYLEDKNV